jgi:hypothetical protein
VAKFLKVRFPDGDWHIPANIIAEDRARYYASHDTGEKSGPKFDEAFKDELDYALSMDGEFDLCDWAANNMNWEDVKAHAVHVKPLAIDYENEWCNAKKTVVEASTGA